MSLTDQGLDRVSPTRRRRVRPVTVAIGLVLAVLAAMWIYAWFFAPVGNIDRFDDRAWAARAETICSGVRTQVEALPKASSFKDVEPKSAALSQRADVIDQVTSLLAGQLTALRAESPSDPTSTKGVQAWLTDWDGYLESRQAQAARLRAGEDTPFAVQEQGGAPVTLRMDSFAEANDMPSCIVPDDIG